MGDAVGNSPKPPAWLPDGWIMKARTRNDGRVDRYYFSPVSGYTFRSKPEVMRYLNAEKVDDPPPVTTTCPDEDEPCVDGPSPVATACFEEDEPCDVEQVKNSPKSLPSGWIQTFKTYQSGANAGKTYKCYIDPLSGSKFYTKAEVFRYLESGKNCKSTSKRKKLTSAEPEGKPLCSATSKQKSLDTDTNGDIQSVIETSPDGLPSGWIKEVKCTKNASGIRKDPYYTDPVSGYVFRSKKDVFRYLETGEIGKYASKPKAKGSANEMNHMENASPPPISAKELEGPESQESGVKRCLFAGKVRKSNRKAKRENGGLLVNNSSSPLADQALLRYEEGAGPSCKGLSGSVFLKDKQVKAINPTQDKVTDLHGNEIPDKPLEPAEEEALDQVIEKLLDSVSKRSPGSSDDKLSDPVTENLKNPSNMEWLEAVGKETLKLADKILSQSSGPVPKKQLEFEGVKAQITPEQKPVGLVESACNVVVEPSNEKPQEMGDNGKMELADQESSKGLHKNGVLGETKRADMESSVLTNATQVEPENRKLLEPEGKFTRDSLSEPNEMSKITCGKTLRQGINESEKEGRKSATGSTQPRKSNKSEKSTPTTRRASKRLAGLEADPTMDIEVGDKSLKRAKQSTQLKSSSGKISLSDNHEVEAEMPKPKDEPSGEQVEAELPKSNVMPLGEQVEAATAEDMPPGKQVEAGTPKDVPLGEYVDLEEQGSAGGTAYEYSECPVASPFGDSWPDPCIEFAFKTLTGQIPVLDTTTIPDYLHEQLSSVQTPTPDHAHTSVAGYPNGEDQADIQTEVNPAGKDHHSLSGAGEFPRAGRVKRLCRRPITRNTPTSGE